jgi:5-formyltetrahydrofolate cyclo-ligase
MRLRLAALDPGRAEKSRAIAAALARDPALASGQWIALFSPLPSEPDVELLWKVVPGRFCYPRVTHDGLDFVEVEKLEHLTPSAWHPNIREHGEANARVVAPEEIGAILVPGLAFTRKGHRLGRGGGFYDRYLAALPATTRKIGVCFALQLVEKIPTEAHDQRMDAVVTEVGVAG